MVLINYLFSHVTLQTDSTYFGGLIGRVANRIGGAKFTLNGVEYNLPANDHGNTLHGILNEEILCILSKKS